MHTTFEINTNGPGLYEITGEVARWVASCGLDEAGLTLFVRHTSASLVIQENADPEVQTDLAAFFHRMVPPTSDPSMSYLKHTYEGPDDMPAHIKSALLPVSITVPTFRGQTTLGMWQGVFLFEHRIQPHRREVSALLR